MTNSHSQLEFRVAEQHKKEMEATIEQLEEKNESLKLEKESARDAESAAK